MFLIQKYGGKGKTTHKNVQKDLVKSTMKNTYQK